MKLLATLILMCALSLFTLGCTNETDEFVAAMDELSTIAKEHQGDCTQQGEALEKHILDNSAALKELGDRLAEARVPDSDKEKILAARKRFVDAVGETCLFNAPILYAKLIDAMGLELQ